jgi:hypothetical protein
MADRMHTMDLGRDRTRLRMARGTSVAVNVLVAPVGGIVSPKSAGTSVEVTIVELESSLGDDAPLPIKRPANAANSVQRFAPAWMLASAAMILGCACRLRSAATPRGRAGGVQQTAYVDAASRAASAMPAPPVAVRSAS